MLTLKEDLKSSYIMLKSMKSMKIIERLGSPIPFFYFTHCDA